MAALYVALVHGPVLNKHGDRITTAVTGLNIHDIARAVTTFGGSGYLLVTPLPTQQRLVRRIIGHWEGGFGSRYNPNRKEALAAVRVADTLADAAALVAGAEGAQPTVVATSARAVDGVPPVAYAALRRRLAAGGPPVLLVFGTGWGLAPEVMAGVDALLPPILGPVDYNHLSVRSAVSIILDRLAGDRETDLTERY
ncbi:MAG: RNA methyltransferase [Nitrospirae bacterium]|nr:RNA methyltransferase [Nitrospirota bacterium]